MHFDGWNIPAHVAYRQVWPMYVRNDFSFTNVLGAAFNQVRFIVRNLRYFVYNILGTTSFLYTLSERLQSQKLGLIQKLGQIQIFGPPDK